jgi:hypothetical protein
MPACVHDILGRGAAALVPLPTLAPAPPEWSAWGAGVVDHAYLLLYGRNAMRARYQRAQLAQLGVNVSVVAAYDREDIDGTVRACTDLVDSARYSIDAGVSIGHANQTGRFSASLKLYVALYDGVARGFSTTLVLEDDVRVHWPRLAALGRAIRNASAQPPPERMTLLFAGSYSENGFDALCCHGTASEPTLRLRPPGYHRYGLMAAVGVVVNRPGALHVLRSLPITDHNDVLLSDRRTRSGAQRGLWYFKPYPFTPAGELQHESSFGRRPLSTREALPVPRPSGEG